MPELIFIVEEAPEGGFSARALGHSIFTDGETMASLKANVREAVACHFEDSAMPRVIRLHFVREELLAV